MYEVQQEHNGLLEQNKLFLEYCIKFTFSNKFQLLMFLFPTTFNWHCSSLPLMPANKNTTVQSISYIKSDFQSLWSKVTDHKLLFILAQKYLLSLYLIFSHLCHLSPSSSILWSVVPFLLPVPNNTNSIHIFLFSQFSF